MKFRILITLFIISLPICLLAQRRQLQEARAIIKSGKNYDQAEKMMTNLLKDSANLHKPRIYEMWLTSVEKQYDQMNEAMYKKQEVDTTKFFELTRRIFTIGERLDSLDMRPDKKGRVSLSYRNDNAQRLATYRPNLYLEAPIICERISCRRPMIVSRCISIAIVSHSSQAMTSGRMIR